MTIWRPDLVWPAVTAIVTLAAILQALYFVGEVSYLRRLVLKLQADALAVRDPQAYALRVQHPIREEQDPVKEEKILKALAGVPDESVPAAYRRRTQVSAEPPESHEEAERKFEEPSS